MTRSGSFDATSFQVIEVIEVANRARVWRGPSHFVPFRLAATQRYEGRAAALRICTIWQA